MKCKFAPGTHILLCVFDMVVAQASLFAIVILRKFRQLHANSKVLKGPWKVILPQMRFGRDKLAMKQNSSEW